MTPAKNNHPLHDAGAGFPARAFPRPAFTLIELLVSVAVLGTAVLAVSQLFNISSQTALRSVAHAEMLNASNRVHETFDDQLSKIIPGFLAIESPPALLVRREIQGEQRRFRVRHDRLVFFTSGDPAEYQSFTQFADPNQSEPVVTDPVTTSQALVYLGPGVPYIRRGLFVPLRMTDPILDDYPISQWVFLCRPLLFSLDDPPAVGAWQAGTMDAFTASSGMLNGGALQAIPGQLYLMAAKRDVVTSLGAPSDPTSLRADADEIIDRINNKPPLDYLANPSKLDALWQESWSPVSVSITDNNPHSPLISDFYPTAGFILQPQMADFRIEWTDGRVLDPLGPDGLINTGDENLNLRWFGLRPDPREPVDLTAPNLIKYLPVRRQDVTQFAGNDPNRDNSTEEENELFMQQIEWSNSSNASSVTARYRAVWRRDTWHLRPRAIRITYRLYDAGNRVVNDMNVDFNEDGVPDPDPQNPLRPAVVQRYGQEFSSVIPIP